MNAKISVVVICVEAIIYLLLHNLHDCTFKVLKPESEILKIYVFREDQFYQTCVQWAIPRAKITAKQYFKN